MRGIKVFIVAIFVVGFFVFIKNFVWAGGLVINEFVSDPEVGNNEWVELYNGSDNSIDLTGYKIFDDTDVKGKYMEGVIDFKSWFLFNLNTTRYLNNDEDSVILKNNLGEEIDRIDYNGVFSPDKGYSLSRLIDGIDNDDNFLDWRVTSFITPGTANVFPTSTESGGEVTTTTITDVEIDWSKIKINELVSDPVEGNEWVEFYNQATSSIDLSGGLVCDNRETGSGCISLSGIVQAEGYLKFDLNTKSFLNNGGDSVILKNDIGEMIDRVDYDDLPPNKGNSLARKIDGVDTNTLDDWSETIVTTPGTANVIAVPVGQTNNNATQKIENLEVVSEFFESTSTYFGQIVFSEIMADPEGDEAAAEFIEVKNETEVAINVEGWVIKSGNGRYKLSGIIFAKEKKIFYRSDFLFSLNNNGGEMVLYDSAGYKVSGVVYNKVKENNSWARKNNFDWLETAVLTPGEENIFLFDSGVSVMWKIVVPDSVRVGRAAEFFVGGSLDPRGGKLNFSWIVDGVNYSGEKLSIVFEEPGKYEIKIITTSTAGTIGEKSFVLTVGAGRVDNDFFVGLSEVCPDPTDGQENEYIEIYNYGLAETDISNWRLRYLDKDFIFSEGTIIQPGQFLSFYRPITKFVLEPDNGLIEFLDGDLGVIDEITFNNLKKGECLAWVNNRWVTTVSSTPREVNFLTAPKIVEEVVKKTTVKKIAGVKVSSNPLAGQVVQLADARTLAKGTPVKISGIVSSLPGIFGTQYFYIFDGTSGIQIYQNKKIFPELRIGDRLAVTGEMSEASGRKRINVKNVNGFDVLATDIKIIPIEVSLSEVNEELFGTIVVATGEITELKSGYMYLDDGTDEIAVYFKPGALIDYKKLKEGMKVKVTGIFENSSAGSQIWPRGMDDIEIILTPVSVEANYEMLPDNSGDSTFKNYLLVTLGGLTLFILGLLVRSRDFLKKLAAKMMIKILK